MILKEQKFSKCPKCGSHKLIKNESYGCDSCKKPIDDLIHSGNTNFAEYLDIAVFSHRDQPHHYQFCSWKCAFKFLKALKCDYFVSLPHLTYEKTTKGQTVEDFLKHIKI